MKKAVTALLLVSATAHGWNPFVGVWNGACWATNKVFEIGKKTFHKGEEFGAAKGQNEILRQQLASSQKHAIASSINTSQISTPPLIDPSVVLQMRDSVVAIEQHQRDISESAGGTKDVLVAVAGTAAALAQSSARSARAAEIGNYIAGVDTAIKVIGVGKEIYEKKYPTEEQRAHIAYLQQRNKVLEREIRGMDAEDALADCLVANERGRKDSDGMPTPCQQAAAAFRKIHGYKKYEEVRKDFKKETQEGPYNA